MNDVDRRVVTDVRVVAAQTTPQILGDFATFELGICVRDLVESLGLDGVDDAVQAFVLVSELEQQPGRPDGARVVETCRRRLLPVQNWIVIPRVEADETFGIRLGEVVGVVSGPAPSEAATPSTTSSAHGPPVKW